MRSVGIFNNRNFSVQSKVSHYTYLSDNNNDNSNKLCSFFALYRSPSQSQDDFATFSDNFEMTLDLVSKENPFLLVVLSDFNAKQWHAKDSSSSEGISVESITSQFGLHQIINKPTHIVENSSSCIGLIFTSQPNLSVESGTQPSLHSK